jgi:hypothetical protein
MKSGGQVRKGGCAIRRAYIWVLIWEENMLQENIFIELRVHSGLLKKELGPKVIEIGEK